MQNPTRVRRNREDNKVVGSDVVGGVKVRATEYCTGRTDVSVKQLVPRTAEQAAYTFN